MPGSSSSSSSGAQFDLVSKDGREKCWQARDVFWKCLDENKEDKTKCVRERELFENNCSKTWIKHFDRRREYLKFRNVIDSGDQELINEYIKTSSSSSSSAKQEQKPK